MLAPWPPGQPYPDVVEAGDWLTDHIHAAGIGPDAITVAIRKPGGQQWDADWVRYVVGHPHNDDATPDVRSHTTEGTVIDLRDGIPRTVK